MKILDSLKYRFLKHDGKIYAKKKGEKEHKEIDPESLPENERFLLSLDTAYWIDINPKDTVEKGFKEYERKLEEEKVLVMIQRQLLRKKNEEIQKESWDEIKNLDVIPCTLENVAVVLKFLHRTVDMENFDSWIMPAMEHGYVVMHYECEGGLVTTMDFYEPLPFGQRFKVGVNSSCLPQYISLDMV